MRNDPVLSRRQALGFLGMLAPRLLHAQAARLEFAAIDHVEFYVSDVDKSRDFFVRLFGNTVLKNAAGSKKYIRLGAAYIAFERPRTADGEIAVDHFSCAIRNLDMARLHAHLEARGIPYRDYPSGRDTAVTDPDGTRTQLSPENGWSFLAPPNFTPDPVTLKDEPVFRPTGIEHVLLHVTDPERSAAFYEKIFGPVSARNNNRIWFQVGRSRVGLLKTPAGQKAGVNHYCVSAEAFHYDAVVGRLQAMGAKVEPAEIAGAPSFRDPDGALVQVMGPRA
jgi:catechol 2,3-dioxygenase-like lactoylglutathione lyase family enzyme